MKRVFILDVRSPEEYENGYKEDAINLPLEDIYNNTEYSKSILNNISKNDEIRLYCASGARSEIAKRLLMSLGYIHIINLGGLDI